MSLPYDASTKYLVEAKLPDWLPLCGRTTTAPVEVLDSDLSTVTAAADRVLHVLEDPAWIMHLELQSSRDPDLLANLPVYNTLLERRHGTLVRSLVVLLRQPADSPAMTGVVERGFPGEPPYLVFRYHVVRVWQLPAETFLTGGLGIVPLAPLSAVAEADLPAVIGRMDQRIAQEATPEEVGTLWTAADVLMGLCYPRALVNDLLRGIHAMKDSVTYQGIVEEGMIKARQEDLLRVGRRKFGAPPSAAIQAAVAGMNDLDRLGGLIERVFDVSSWDELLASP
jgi:hypothetical protein